MAKTSNDKDKGPEQRVLFLNAAGKKRIVQRKDLPESFNHMEPVK